ncbi:MAG TPA: glycoside hydrolase family 127 protein, partial [bacterium]|nr:glycoside hydrolase family 127 protein [bacterium]
WANMVMLFCLQSYYEYSGDKRVLDLMTGYFKYQLSVPDDKFLTHYWQKMRGGDNLYSVYWLYNRTGDKWLLNLARKIHAHTADWEIKNDLPDWHNVNIAQGFREPAIYYMQTHAKSDLDAAYANFRIVREKYGQVPGGMYGGDEISREGYDDPRQGIETCGIVEQMLSDEMMLRITGDAFWADHCEDVAFNTLPAAFLQNFKALRYFTCPNMPMSDVNNHAPGINNSGPFFIMNPLSNRCCQHNHSHGWPYFTENLWSATPDNGAAAVLYAPSSADIKVGNGSRVKIEEETVYPFEETIRLKIKTDKPAQFPLYVRIPKWCVKPSITLNGNKIFMGVGSQKGKFVRIERKWNNNDKLTLLFPMDISVNRWSKNHNSASVNYGPLTFSLRIDEKYIRRNSEMTALWDSKWQKKLKTKDWPAYEIIPKSDWNYGLVLRTENPVKSFVIVRKPWPENNFPFSLSTVPIEMKASGKKIVQWKFDRYGLVAPLQDSPVASNEPTEDITLAPMGAARIRISEFPVIGDGPDAVNWTSEAPEK